MPMQIRKLTIDKFRGAANKLELTFKHERPLIMIFGENGTGKSTIVDAIDFIANENIGSLLVRSSVSVKQHAPTIGHKPENIDITLETATDKWTGSLVGARYDVKGSGTRPRVHILRRGQLLRLTEAAPSERYKELAQFIDVASVEQGEDRLKKALDQVKQSHDQHDQSQIEAAAALEELWKAEGSPGTAALAWAEAKAKEDISAKSKEASHAQKWIALLSTLRTHATSHGTATSDVERTETEVEGVRGEIASHVKETNASQIEMVQLLVKAQAFLKKAKTLKSCPVCEQSIQKKDLVAGVDAKLLELQQAQSLQEKLVKAEKNYEHAVTARNVAIEKLITSLRDAITLFTGTTLTSVASLEDELKGATALLAKGSLTEEEQTTLVHTANQLVGTQASIQKTFDELTKTVNQHNSIKLQHERFQSSADAVKKEKALASALDRAHKKCQAKRKEFYQQILAEVAKEADKLYSIIHPGETTGLSEIRIEKKSSLEHVANFHGHTDVPPQAYFSDSHLDTLGLTLWLAIAKRQDPKNSIAVLDDVFTSVDSPHLNRICDLLNEECKCFGQMIVATHYRNWRDRYRFGESPGGSITHLIELQRWSLNRGVSPIDSKLAITQLRKAIDAKDFDRQVVAAKAGILLEALLDTLASQYRCRLPRNRDNLYTLNDLTGTCTELFKKMKVEHEGDPAPVEPKETFLKIKDMPAIRNEVGCHHNEFGKAYSDNEVVEFAEETYKLTTMVTCRHCAELARKDKTSHFECSCKKLKMTPMKV